MRGAVAGTAARVAGGIGIVACAAVVALAAGGGNVFGGLGGLFGASGPSLEVAKTDSAQADIVAAPNAAERAATQRALLGKRNAPGISHPRAHHRTRPPASAPPRQPASGQPAPLPGPAPSPQVPPPPAPAPTPGGGQVVTTVGQTVKQVTSQLPPPAQPITQPVGDAVDTLVQTCTNLPVCP